MPHISRHDYEDCHEGFGDRLAPKLDDPVRCVACKGEVSRYSAERLPGGKFLCFPCADEAAETMGEA